VLAYGILAGSTLIADTVFLKDGTQIRDCRITSETETHVYLRTPVGNMGVPRTEIARIQRVKTVYDTYKEQLARIPAGDANNLYKLALWCRSRDELRKESNELLDKVIELNPDHAAARRLLGHLKPGNRWVVPPPLLLDLRVSGSNTAELRSNLDLFLETRTDVQLSPEAMSKSTPQSASKSDDDDLSRCRLDASVLVVRTAGTRFYGQALGPGSIGVTVRLQAHSPWLGSTALKTAVDGLVPSTAGDMSLGVQNALSRGGGTLHKFLDRVTAARLRKLEVALRKEERERQVAPKPVPSKAPTG
jgi:hypothetical protein